jgi:HEAT repeat protein
MGEKREVIYAALVDYIKNNEQGVGTAITALGRLGNERAIPLLEKIAKGNDAYLSKKAQSAIAAIKTSHEENRK